MLSTAPSNIFAQEENKSSATGNSWTLDRLNVPVQLKPHAEELEKLLNKVFNNCPETNQNIELAKQLAINWCSSKCKELDIPAEDCISEISA